MNEDLKRKYYLLKELWEDCGRRYRQYGSDKRIHDFLWNAWVDSRRAFEVVEGEYRQAGFALAEQEAAKS